MPAAALAELDRAIAEGVDVGQLLDQLFGYFRDVMAAAVGCPADALLHVSPAEQSGVCRNRPASSGWKRSWPSLQILDQIALAAEVSVRIRASSPSWRSCESAVWTISIHCRN